MCAAIRWAIQHWTDLDASVYARLLHLRDEYGVTRFRVDEGKWIAGKTVGATRLAEEGLLILGIECPGGNFVGAPPADVTVRAGDEIVVYGPATRISELDARLLGDDGDRAHSDASAEHRERVDGERRRAGR